MSKVGVQRATELTGKSKSTIQRSMDSGKLSFEVDEAGKRLIDVSELERVYGLKAEKAQDTEGMIKAELEKAAAMLETERLKMRVRALEDQLHMTREQLDDAKAQREQWQRQASQVLITSQYQQKQTDELREQIRERDKREAERKSQFEERMKRLRQQSQNQNTQQQGQMQQDDNSFWGKLRKRLQSKAA